MKSLVFAAAVFTAPLAAGLSTAQAAPLSQYASSVIDYSTQYSSTSWSAAQVLGTPNTFTYGDIATAWAPSASNGTLEFITVGFEAPVYATGAVVRETYGNGFVYKIDALDTFGGFHTVWSGIDTSLAGSAVDFTVSWATTSYLVSGLKIFTNTDHDLGAWEEIDAIQLVGVTEAAIPEPGMVALFSLGLLGFAASRRKAAK